jgi:hypothetical protein
MFSAFPSAVEKKTFRQEDAPPKGILHLRLHAWIPRACHARTAEEIKEEKLFLFSPFDFLTFTPPHREQYDPKTCGQ